MFEVIIRDLVPTVESCRATTDPTPELVAVGAPEGEQEY